MKKFDHGIFLFSQFTQGSPNKPIQPKLPAICLKVLRKIRAWWKHLKVHEQTTCMCTAYMYIQKQIDCTYLHAYTFTQQPKIWNGTEKWSKSFPLSLRAENDNFDQRLECAAPKRWSKYTTLNINFYLYLKVLVSTCTACDEYFSWSKKCYMHIDWAAL